MRDYKNARVLYTIALIALAVILLLEAVEFLVVLMGFMPA